MEAQRRKQKKRKRPKIKEKNGVSMMLVKDLLGDLQENDDKDHDDNEMKEEKEKEHDKEEKLWQRSDRQVDLAAYL